MELELESEFEVWWLGVDEDRESAGLVNEKRVTARLAQKEG